MRRVLFRLLPHPAQQYEEDPGVAEEHESWQGQHLHEGQDHTSQVDQGHEQQQWFPGSFHVVGGSCSVVVGVG
ncbi:MULTISPECIES: hypothetical protein [Nocardiopsis]|uniref:hypothetical protein n=1 Tax=Nocardiopsis TaxID=2013 RepID=UPI00117F3319|nr:MULTISPECIES: hypothetical protein [Nocardiopsis]